MLGGVSLSRDVTSKVIHAVLPIFLVGTLGASATLAVAIEGVAEVAALGVKVVSGTLSGALGWRKGLT